MSTPACSLKASHRICPCEPTPAVPQLSLPGLALGVGHQLLQRVDGQGGVHGEQQRAVRELGDRHEVLERIVGRLAQMRQDDDAEGGRDDEGVAVGRRLHRGFQAERTGCSAAVLDDELLAEHARQTVREWSHRVVGGAAGTEVDDDAAPCGSASRRRPAPSAAVLSNASANSAAALRRTRKYNMTSSLLPIAARHFLARRSRRYTERLAGENAVVRRLRRHSVDAVAERDQTESSAATVPISASLGK